MYEPFDAAEDLQDELKEDDDERVIADMSGLAPKRPILFPVFDAGKQMDAQKEQFRAKPQQPRADLDREGRLAAVKGALGATLLIWLVYAAGFGIFLFVLTRLFKLL
ncbi:MAG: hypothetical protein IKN28_06670 [Firmicutes bacterium]|nr:hypothetical protein [Bacillota bacterium]MBR3749536.1 hypothetical protein [Bacillota bacterium]MBR6970370.1 hypothetical protein [Bacillota bacterium]